MRSRIKEHRRVKARDLVPHELNPRTHTPQQRAILTELYQQVGFARSLLAYETADGRLKLIDGHLRASLTPDDEVDVEILDVNDDEARTLLLSIDPLAQLAQYDADTLAELRQISESDSEVLQTFWQTVDQASLFTKAKVRKSITKEQPDLITEQFAVMITCADEKEQITLLRRFKQEGLICKAVIS